VLGGAVVRQGSGTGIVVEKQDGEQEDGEAEEESHERTG
jgi:hypothetical protein